MTKAAARASARFGGLSMADLMLLGCVMIWSVNVSFVKLLMRDWSPFSLAAVRMLMALAAFAVIVWRTEGTARVRREDVKLLVAAGFSGIFLNQAAFVLALHFSKASGVALLLSMIPVFVALISAAVGFERFTRWSVAGLVISLAGVVLIVTSQPGTHLSLGTVQGNAFALLTALSWAVYTILLQPLLRRYSPARIGVWVIAVGLALLLPPGIATLNTHDIVSAAPWTWAALLYTAVASIVITNFLWYIGTSRLGPARGSLYAFLQPFLGALAAVLILGDRISFGEVLGGGGVIAGILVARRRPPPVIDEQPAAIPAIAAGQR